MQWEVGEEGEVGSTLCCAGGEEGAEGEGGAGSMQQAC